MLRRTNIGTDITIDTHLPTNVRSQRLLGSDTKRMENIPNNSFSTHLLTQSYYLKLCLQTKILGLSTHIDPAQLSTLIGYE